MQDSGTAVCHLLDVGQGCSNIITLSGNRAIVIDGGPAAKVPLSVLKRLKIEVIEALIVSHNDTDHSKGVPAIVLEYFDRIERVIFLEDRPISKIGWFQDLRRALPKRQFKQMTRRCFRLEIENAVRQVWHDERGLLSLELLFPSFSGNLEAKQDERPNATSGVLAFRRGHGSVMFPGDATIEVWRSIHERWGTLECDIIAAPHHGGKLTDKRPEQESNDLEWLFSEAIVCRNMAYFSLGTRNTRGHPRGAYVRALRKAGINVMCSEITTQCTDHVAELGVGLLGPKHYPSSRCALRSSRKKAIGCAGTVRVEMDDEGVRVDGQEAHRVAVNELSLDASGHPLCR